jgi:hypothetical protein
VRSLSIALGAVLAAAGCGRSYLDPYHPVASDAAVKADRVDAPPDLLPDTRPDLSPDLPIERPPDLSPIPTCVPKGPETCNGVDDDCNGIIDDNLPAIPCPEGGSRVCVGGAFSECPRRCEVCVPGSKRTCITSFCTFWGSQACASDGLSWGACRETQAPEVCREVANRMMRSPELEKCCIENDFCCVDEFDLDNDGDRTEMLGRCEAVVCD